MNLDSILLRLGDAALPSFIQLIMALMAFVGMLVIFSSMSNLYMVLQEDFRRPSRDNRPLSLMVRCIIGGLMTIPAVVLWRAADAALGGGASTEAAVLAYINGAVEMGYCDRFVRVVNLLFMAVGIIGVFNAFLNFDDKAKGFNPNGVRSGVVYLLGGLACFYIVDVVRIVANTLGVDAGVPQLCAALGSPS